LLNVHGSVWESNPRFPALQSGALPLS